MSAAGIECPPCTMRYALGHAQPGHLCGRQGEINGGWPPQAVPMRASKGTAGHDDMGFAEKVWGWVAARNTALGSAA